MFLKRWWSIICAWCKRSWECIRPGPETHVGIYWASALTLLVAALVGGIDLKSGFGLPVDLTIALLVATIGVGLVGLATALVLLLLRQLPKLLTGVLLGTCLLVSLLMAPAGFVLVPLAAIAGATIATLWKGEFASAHLSKKILTVVLGIASSATLIVLLVMLVRNGSDDDRIELKGTVSPLPAAIPASNPSIAGSFGVKQLLYGSGTDLRRPDFQSKVALKTNSVDASGFFKDFKGWKADLRKYYWGFGTDKFPLNARVWYPEGAGPFPLILMVHGNHNMADFSDPGYAYLGELLASRGFIFASIDENFLNGWIAELPKEQAVRGWMLLEHLQLWKRWNVAPSNPFQGKVDLDNISLMGHSRGGEAAATAVFFNTLAYYPDDATIPFSYGFHIKSIVAIAPADGQYKPAGTPRTIQNVSYLTLQGSHDADVSSFAGSSQFDRVKLTKGDQLPFKAEIYAYRANHGQFNTVWGTSDIGDPSSSYLNLKALLTGEEQRQISRTYISAFVEATLHGKREYLPLFRDHRTAREWLPKTLYMNRYLDATYTPLANFTEDGDVTSTTLEGGHISAQNLSVWKEGRIPTRSSERAYNGVFLGWNRGKNNKLPLYEISLPKTGAHGSTLVLSLATTNDKAPEPGKHTDPQKDDKKKDSTKDETTDLTVEVETITGTKASLPLSRFGNLMPMFRAHFTKFPLLDENFYKKAAEPVPQTFELPLRAFGLDDASQIQTIRLRFDKTVSRVLILTQIGFEDTEK